MFKNYFKSAWRNLLKNKTFSLINILGLAVSMSVCLLIILIIADQNSYDGFHTKKERIYRVHTQDNKKNYNPTASSALPLAKALEENYTGIEATASLVKNIGGDIFYKEKVASGGGYFADANLFKIMDFKLKSGNAATALNNPFSMLISAEMAELLFHGEDPVGKLVRFNDTGINPAGPETGNRETAYGNFTITGVLEDNPGKSGLPFKLLASLSTIPALNQDSILHYPLNDWSNVWTAYTYVLMEPGKSKADLQHMLDDIAAKQYDDPNAPGFAFTAEALMDLRISNPIGNMTYMSLPKSVLIFLTVLCCIIMLSACLNYTNLSVARALSRAKEVGIRKVSGANKSQIFTQFVAEALLVAFVSLLISFLLLFILQPLFSSLWLNSFFNVSFHYTWELGLIFLGFSAAVGLIAGLLPAIYMSAFNPVQILKSINSIRLFKGLTFRKVLLVVQFAVSLIFIVSAAMIYAQTDHVLHFDYGFNKDNVVNVKLYKTDNYQRFAQAISSNKNIRSIGACSFPPASGTQNSTLAFRNDNGRDSLQSYVIDVDANCLDVWDIKLVAGKNLPVNTGTNVEQYLLINEKMVAEFKYPSVAAAVGQHLQVDGKDLTIAGVVKDFQFLEVNRGMAPLLLRNRPGEFGFATIRLSGTDAAAAVASMQKAWKEVNPNTRFEYEFYDQQLHIFHSLLRDAAGIIGTLAFLAVFVSCLGLLGMAVYTAETRRKEIGVRKVLGSSVPQIMLLLSKHYMLLLTIGVVVSIPLAYLLNNAWLQFFASRVQISVFIISGAVLLLSIISMLIVFSQAWRVSRINPVESLRSE